MFRAGINGRRTSAGRTSADRYLFQISYCIYTGVFGSKNLFLGNLFRSVHERTKEASDTTNSTICFVRWNERNKKNGYSLFSNNGRVGLPGKTAEFGGMADYTISYE